MTVKLELSESWEIADITCNMCGKSTKDELTGVCEDIHVEQIWGYGSSRDGERWSFDLCEICALKVKDFIESEGGKIDIEQRF